MDDQELKQMCLSLLRADSEKEVIEILQKEGVWDTPNLWRYYGDKDTNFATIGSQQSKAEAALAEKVVNSVDAVLMSECWLRGMNPEDTKAPKSIHEAVALYFYGDAKKSSTLGHIGYWSDEKRKELSRKIRIAATGARAASEDRANPCFTISDEGEGQTPEALPYTILSLDRKNKVQIQFVQGKFNMGGTGVFQFCGTDNLQFVLSRRNPNLPKIDPEDESANMWGFTVVRRENPPLGHKSSIYTYLAPIDAENYPHMGGVLRFYSASLPILPEGQEAYKLHAKWGTVIKLYEYAATGFRTIMFRKDGLLSRLDVMLPEIALPVRLYECRDYKGHTGSFETTMSGLSVRLEDNKAENLEDDFPTTCPLKAGGEEMTAKIYAFKKGRAETYRKSEGIIFTVNGQTHGHLPLTFFSRKSVGMDRLDDSILVFLDCSNLSVRAREDLFMNSRDKMRNTDLRDEIEHVLEILIRDHPGLRELREKRRREEIASKLKDTRPLQLALKSILKSSPSLASLFLTGTRLSNPFKTKEVGTSDVPYKGKLHPSYFKFLKLDYGQKLERTTPINMRSRITFETDVANDYFDRMENRGTFYLHIVDNGKSKEVESYVLNLQNGRATLSVKLPKDTCVGDVIEFEAKITDDTLIEPFVNRSAVTVGEPQVATGGGSIKDSKPPGEKKGSKHETPLGIAIPEIHEVQEKDWPSRKHKFDKYSALEIVQEEAADGSASDDSSQAIYSFWVNVDNIYLKTEMKSSKSPSELIKARFVYSMVLVGMALIQSDINASNGKTMDEKENQSKQDGELTLQDRVFYITVAISPVILPLIESLGTLTEKQLTVGSQVGDDE